MAKRDEEKRPGQWQDYGIAGYSVDTVGPGVRPAENEFEVLEGFKCDVF